MVQTAHYYKYVTFHNLMNSFKLGNMNRLNKKVLKFHYKLMSHLNLTAIRLQLLRIDTAVVTDDNEVVRQ